MKIVLDMNLSPSWVERLKAAGFDCVHWSSLGLASAPDTEIMAFANVHGYVVLTQDLDFGEILAATQGEKPSVLQIRSDDLSFAVIGAAVVAALRQSFAELEVGALVIVDPRRTRLRMLPLASRK
jgi:predicted nuclease of predicted toxin-antitoxin system